VSVKETNMHGQQSCGIMKNSKSEIARRVWGRLQQWNSQCDKKVVSVPNGGPL
jgi:hypothetical protein